jgi:predicted house-cleaning noncanonical NTP pyrophosphatase (MazG superfamily)
VRPVTPKTAKVYNKLVRDKIPEIIEMSGTTCTVETLAEEKYIAMLDAKLTEELAEYQESKSLEELADLLEVMGAVVKARGYTWEQLTAIRKKKLEDRGGFEKRILLKEVYENGASPAEPVKQTPPKAQPRNAGKPWTELEDHKLEDEFDSQMPIAAIAQEHGRTKGAIESRLVRLGKITKPKAESPDK